MSLQGRGLLASAIMPSVKGCWLLVLLLVAGLGLACSPDIPSPIPDSARPDFLTVRLPKPSFDGDMSLEEALLRRRSVRDYVPGPLKLEDVSQLLWAAQGVTTEWGGRTAPSAGGLYPLELLLVAGAVENLSPGVYRYDPRTHELVRTRDGDVREQLAAAALDQSWVREGSISIVIAAVYERTTGKYGDRGVRYVDMEAGHAAQNVYLQATALNLGTVTIGAFQDDQVKDLLRLSQNETPLYVMPVGRNKD